MNTCEHKTSTVMEHHGNVSLSECDWGCGAILVSVTDGNGISHEFTADELLALRQWCAKVDSEAGTIIDNEQAHVAMYHEAMQENGRLRKRVVVLEAARKWLNHIYVNATSDDAGEDFRFYFESDEILAIESVLDATPEEAQQ